MFGAFSCASEKKKFTFVAFSYLFNALIRKIMKGNPFFGQARGKVGDMVFYRADGEQIARSLNRHPRNPNTDAQIIQRATMAVVQRLYSLGYPIFNHAFQGYRPGAENQRRFIKVNAKKIRDAVLASLNGSETPVYLGAPGILSPSANAYIVSEGNYDQALFAYDATVPANPVFKLPAVGEATTIAEYAAAHGMVPGDIYTFLGVFTKADVMDYEYFDTDGQLVEEASVRKASFAYIQLKVKDDILSNTAAVSSSTTWSELFDEVRGTAGDTTLNSGLSMVEVAGFDGSGAWGCIRSRENEDLRSTTQLQLFGAQSGVTPEWLFKVWSKETANLASDLILEGADFNGGGEATPSSTPNIESANYNLVQLGEFQPWPDTESQELYTGQVTIDIDTDYHAVEDGEALNGIVVEVRYPDGEGDYTPWLGKTLTAQYAGDTNFNITLTPQIVGSDTFEARIVRNNVQYKAIIQFEPNA